MTAVNALGPITFNAEGRQYEIPLSQLFFDHGALKADRWDDYATAPVDGPFQKAVNAWLGYLVQAEVITPAKGSAPQPAMLITAKDPGAAGNDISLSISSVTEKPAGSGTFVFDAAVKETDVHKGLTAANVIARLGGAAGGGSEPGLVFVSSPSAFAPRAGTYALGGTPDARADIPKSGVTGPPPPLAPADVAFTLQAKATGAEGAFTSVTIVSPGTGGDFDLTATWSNTASAVAPSALQSKFPYEIVVAPPPGQTATSAPAAGTYKLTGGSNASGPVTAKAVLPGRS